MNVRTQQALRAMVIGPCVLAFAMFLDVAVADQAVYKCGQEITNQPVDPKLCQQLNISQPTQIDGTRVQPTVQKVLGPSSTDKLEALDSTSMQPAVVQAGTANEASDRKVQARTILEDEWQKLTSQYTELVRNYNRGQPSPLPGESIHQPNYQQRTLALKSQLQRVERDLQALQRELSRYGVRMSAVPSK